MITREDLKQLANTLRGVYGIKDTELNTGIVPLRGNEYLAIIQDGENKKISLSDLIAKTENILNLDIYNISKRNSHGGFYRFNLDEAIQNIPIELQVPGQLIVFKDYKDTWRIYQFIGTEISEWTDTSKWQDILDTFNLKSVSTVSDLYTLPNRKLSVNQGKDANGQIWYVKDTDAYYKLIDYSQYTSSSGWKQLSINGKLNDDLLNPDIARVKDLLDTTGTGSKVLTNRGTYKTITLDSTGLTIDDNTGTPVQLIKKDGGGQKVLNDRGEYVDVTDPGNIPAIPLYNTKGVHTDGAMTQKASVENFASIGGVGGGVNLPNEIVDRARKDETGANIKDSLEDLRNKIKTIDISDYAKKDLSNVNESDFNNKQKLTNLYKEAATRSNIPITDIKRAYESNYYEYLTATDISKLQGNNILLLYKIDHNDQVITQQLPIAAANKHIIVGIKRAVGVTRGSVKFIPATGEQVNDKTAPIIITEEGWDGIFIPINNNLNSTYKFVHYEQAIDTGMAFEDDDDNFFLGHNTIKIHDFTLTERNDVLEMTPKTMTSIGVSSNLNPSGNGKVKNINLLPPLQAHIDPNKPVGQETSNIEIKHGYYELSKPGGYLAYLNTNAFINKNSPVNDSHLGSIWFDDIIVAGGTYLQTDKDSKAILIGKDHTPNPSVVSSDSPQTGRVHTSDSSVVSGNTPQSGKDHTSDSSVVSGTSIHTGRVHTSDPDVISGTSIHTGKDHTPNPSVVSDTITVVGFVASFMGKAEEDGDIEIYFKDRTTGQIISNQNGQLMSRKKHFKQGEDFGKMLLVDIYQAKGQVGFIPCISHTFTNPILLDDYTKALSGVMFQYLDTNHKTGEALRQFEIDLKNNIRFTSHYLGDYFYTIKYWLQQNLPYAESDIGDAQDSFSGDHFYNTTRMGFSILNREMIFKDAGDVCYFNFGKIFNAEDTKALWGKTLKVTLNIHNQKGAYKVGLAYWTGTPDKYTNKIITDTINNTEVTEANWILDPATFLISKDVVSDYRTVTHDFIVKGNPINMAVIIYPENKKSPTLMKLKQFQVDVTPGFKTTYLQALAPTGESILKYNTELSTYSVGLPPGIDNFKYVVNNGWTNMPSGIQKGNSDLKIINDWHSGGNKWDAEGSLISKIRGKATIYNGTIRVHDGMSMPATSTIDFALFKVNNDGTFSEIPNSRLAAPLKKGQGYVEYNLPVFSFIAEANVKYRWRARTGVNDGAYLKTDSNTVSLLKYTVRFKEII